MNAEKRSDIYNRLLAIKVDVEVRGVPDPQYLNQKLGECHVYREEVERYTIEAYQAISVLQQAFNNARASYEAKKETLLSQDQEIKALPNIKDREAKVNSKVRAEQEALRNYDNDLMALNHILKALSLKARNLNSANADIKSYIKVMEAQLKIGSGLGSDPAMKSLMAELSKSKLGKDSFEDSVTTEEEEVVVDPSSPIDINNLLEQGKDGLEDLPQIMDTDTPEPGTKEAEPILEVGQPAKVDEIPTTVEVVSDAMVDPYASNIEVIQEEESEEEAFPIEDEEPFTGVASDNPAPENSDDNDTAVSFDLDNIIDFTEKGGIEPQIQKTEKLEEVVEQKKAHETSESKTDPVIVKETTISSGIDLDALLEDLQISKEK